MCQVTVFFVLGEAWLDYREGTYADQVPREEDIKTGGKILNKLLQFKNVEKNSIEGMICNACFNLLYSFHF